ncbi:hypothetical protein evm_006292 [Chilo suppressalis]|nr:hypothetical protein evm_006292 [Chilo suppressalis]
MLCRKLIGQALIGKSTLKTNAHLNSLINSRHFSRRCILLDSLLAAVVKPERSFSMSSFRLVFKDLNVRRLWSAWSRSFLANTVIKRFKRDRSVREVIQCFRQAVLRPRRTLLLSTAAFKFNEEEDSSQPPSCGQSITDNELEALVTELESVEELFQSTLFCIGCGRRIIIDKKLTGVRYCACKEAQLPDESYDGWLPYMEAEDVIIWRKEYKPGQGLYAYKVYLFLSTQSSKDGPELENAEDRTPEQSSQNEVENSTPQKDAIQNEQCVDKKEEPVTEVHTATVKQETKSPAPKEGDSDKQDEEDSNTGCWWRNEEDHMFSTL